MQWNIEDEFNREDDGDFGIRKAKINDASLDLVFITTSISPPQMDYGGLVRGKVKNQLTHQD